MSRLISSEIMACHQIPYQLLQPLNPYISISISLAEGLGDAPRAVIGKQMTQKMRRDQVENKEDKRR